MWERCPKCPSRNLKEGEKPKKVIPGVGDENASVMFVGEAGGRQENAMGLPFVGKTGDEMDGTYFPLCGESRDTVWLTNACKCHWADSSDPPPNWLVDSCADFHLRRELAEVKPKLVVLMGGVSNRLAGFNMEMEHGFLHPDQVLLGHKCDIFSTFHPALAMHKGSTMLALLNDFKNLKKRILVPTDAFPNPEFIRLRTARQVQRVMNGQYHKELAIDTESMKRWRGFPSTIRWTPWCATFCMEPGYAFMVRCCDEEAWAEFGRQSQKFRWLLMHNADHDMEVLLQAGVPLDWKRVTDTMQIAYQDGRHPKGLKALGYRLLGARNRSFDDVVVPHGRTLAIEFMKRAAMETWSKPPAVGTGVWEWKNCKDCGGDGVITKRKERALLLGVPASEIKGLKGATEKVYCKGEGCKRGKVRAEKMSRKHSVGEKINQLTAALEEDPEGTDYLKRWNGWNVEDIQEIVEKIGPVPLPSIEQATEDEAIEYACADAHNTKRIAGPLRASAAQIRRKVRD